MKRFSIFYMTVILFCTFFVGTIYSQDKYYCRLGPQPLVKCDSIVSVKFCGRQMSTSAPLSPVLDKTAFLIVIFLTTSLILHPGQKIRRLRSEIYYGR